MMSVLPLRRLSLDCCTDRSGAVSAGYPLGTNTCSIGSWIGLNLLDFPLWIRSRVVDITFQSRNSSREGIDVNTEEISRASFLFPHLPTGHFTLTGHIK